MLITTRWRDGYKQLMCLFVIASQADSCDKSTEKNGIVEMEQEKGAEKGHRTGEQKRKAKLLSIFCDACRHARISRILSDRQ